MIFTDEQWNNITKMPNERRNHEVAALDNKIYVTGGRDNDQQIMSSVDCYDPDTNSWSQVANMNIARSVHSLVSLHGRLYAIGGHYDESFVDSVRQIGKFIFLMSYGTRDIKRHMTLGAVL